MTVDPNPARPSMQIAACLTRDSSYREDFCSAIQPCLEIYLRDSWDGKVVQCMLCAIYHNNESLRRPDLQQVLAEPLICGCSIAYQNDAEKAKH